MIAGRSLRDASAIAEEAFVLAYPLVVTSLAMEQARAPVNVLLHSRDTPDTLRISAWLDLDLAAEPIVLVVPPTRGRYYVVWLRDAWDRVFASVGARTTGTAPQALGLLGPGRHDVRLPPGLTPVAAPTRIVRVTGCLEAIGETDDEVRHGFALLPLSRWPSARAPVTRFPAAAYDPVCPVEQVERMDARAFFAAVSRLVDDNPPGPDARAALTRLRGLGSWSSMGPEQRASLEHGVQRGRAAVRVEAARSPGEAVGRWRIGYESQGDPLCHAGAVRSGLLADPATDVLSALLDSDADGRPLTGRCRYRLRFAPDASPPAHGFWSLTTRAGTPGGTHAIGDLRGLELAPDGSLPIHIQHRPPARRRQANWLPAPPDGFSVALHLYWPDREALQRRWSPPPLIRVE